MALPLFGAVRGLVGFNHLRNAMAKRKCQLRLLGENPPGTLALFPGGEYEGCSPDDAGPYELPDEIAYNAKRKKEGLFVLNTEEEEPSHETAS